MGVRGWEANGRHAKPRGATAEKRHPAVAKLALALREYKEAVEREAATADILRALSRSSRDPQPVFDAIVEHAHRLCGAVFSVVYRYDGSMIHVVADKQVSAKASRVLRSLYPMVPSRKHIVGRAIFEGRPCHSGDLLNDARFPANRPSRNAFTRLVPYRAGAAVPLLRNGTVLGAFAVARLEPRPFTKREIRLLQTFADQAALAMENVRLFNETKEALERQTATSEILGVISGSPTDTQPVFDVIAKNAMRLIGGLSAAVTRRIGNELHLVGFTTTSAAGDKTLKSLFPVPLADVRSVFVQAFRNRAPIYRADTEAPDVPLQARKVARARGFRSMLAVPMLREGEAIGTINVSRREPGEFTAHQIDLLKTFAAQAVIAIENARLFHELEGRNAELDQSLRHQTATSEVLRIVSRSMADAKPVFDAILAAVLRLFDGFDATVWIVDKNDLLAVARDGPTVGRTPGDRVPISLDYVGGIVVLGCKPLRVDDVRATKHIPETAKRALLANRRHAVLWVPLMRDGGAIGAVSVSRAEPFPFTDKHVALLENFADQAVIAIENARLFREIQERNAELKQSLDFQSASGEILASISSSIADTQPVFDAIVRNLMRLLGTEYAAVTLLRGGQLELAAFQGGPGTERIRDAWPVPLAGEEHLTARAIVRRQVVQVSPIVGNPEAPPATEKLCRVTGYQSAIAAPMIRGGEVIGAIAAARLAAQPFDDKQVALIKAFADQAVIAIENARLFNETKEALERQTATAEILKVISSTPTDTQPVFDAIVESAQRIISAKSAVLLLRRAQEYFVAAFSIPGLAEMPAELRTVPLDPERNFPSRVILNGEVLHIPDWEANDIPEHEKRVAEAFGFGSGVQVPLMRKGEGIGALVVTRATKGPFPDKEIALLQAFADQAVIAIENVRLFNETKEALEHQKASAEILRVISSSMGDTQPVFDAIVASCARLFPGYPVGINVLGEDGKIELRASQGIDQDAVRRTFRDLAYRHPGGGVFLRGQITHYPDIEAPGVPEPVREGCRAAGVRAALVAPMIAEGRGIGSLWVCRKTPGAFSEKEIALLQTFADQAVIAIRNARLFNETKEALERQTATAGILRVISSTPTDTQPVFDAIVQSGLKVFAGTTVAITLAEGDRLRVVASGGDLGLMPMGLYVPRSRESATGTAVAEAIVVNIKDTEAPDAPPHARDNGRKLGFRAIAAAPMLREGQSIGGISVIQKEPGGLSDKQLELLKTFADQAVIAIENVRLFKELEARNKALSEALEQQTATGEILKVISGSPTDVQPVFDTIVRSGAQLCAGELCTLIGLEGETLALLAMHNYQPDGEAVLRGLFPRPLSRDTNSGRAILEKRTVQIPDVLEDSQYGIQSAATARAVVSVPLMREGKPVGALTVGRKLPGLFSEEQVALLRTFADQAVIAIENVRLFKELEARNKALGESLEQQTATADILKVISSSTTDTQPVFESIVQSAARLFPSCNAALLMREGERLMRKAISGPRKHATVEELNASAPMWVDPNQNVSARAVLERRTIEVLDMEAPGPGVMSTRSARMSGYRSAAVIPLLKGGEAIGTIALTHHEAGFKLTDKQLALLRTFADQAVIAIENVRLFNATKESLERQTATGEILSVISRSPADVQPVFDAIAHSAVRLCGGLYGAVYRFDGKLVHFVAHHGFSREALELHSGQYPRPPRGLVGSAVLERSVIHAPDVSSDGRSANPQLARTLGYRSFLGVPMLRDGEPIGVIAVFRSEQGPFPDAHIAVLRTFADQAVIAIENVRLFNETREALERQTATAEILKVISSSPTDVQPVFAAIARSAVALCGALFANVFRYDGKLVHYVASEGVSAEGIAIQRRSYPMPPDRSSVSGRVILGPSVERMEDSQKDPAYNRRFITAAGGARRMIGVPMLREGRPLGAIVVGWPSPGPIAPAHEHLLTTFADQAAIAIENVRLFNELRSRTEALAKSVQELTALGEVGQAIGSTLELETVLKTIVTHAVKLTGLDAGVIYEYDEGRGAFELRASENFDEESVAGLREAPIRRGEGAVGRAVATRAAGAVPDTHASDYPARLRELLDRQGFRAVLAVPLVREEHTIGALMVLRKSPGPFAPEIVELLGTLASQSALAIQNARLFREIEDKGRQLETASRHKSQFLASMSHELRTPLNAILGFNEMIIDQVYGDVPQDMKAPLENIQSSGKHLLRLINNVLDLAKIEAGRMELALSDYLVQDTVAGVHTTLKPLAAEKGLEFVAEVPADIPPARGDPGRLAQCLMNLAGNSLKFTKQGRVAIGVAQRDGLLRFSVADTGIGIPPEKIASLFTEFKQTDATIASEYGGTGLGLSITKKFIEMHGGRIWVESEPGKGSTFLFEIPLRVAR